MDIVVIEDQAHLGHGHFPNRFAWLAEGFAELGARVHLLTACGWSLEQAFPLRFDRVHRFGGAALLAHRLAERLQALARRRSVPARVRLGLLRICATARGVAIALAVGALHRRHPKLALAVNVSARLDIRAAMVFASGLPWVHHGFAPRPERTDPVDRLATRMLALVFRWRGRRSAAPRVVMVPCADWVGNWQSHLAVADVVHGQLAGYSQAQRRINLAARQAQVRQNQQAPRRAPVALVFGAHHSERDLATVLAALALGEGWTLVVAGQIAGDPRLAALPEDLRRRITCHPGSQSVAQKQALYRAADFAILSFHAGYARNSGTLMDCFEFALPAVVSSDSHAAAVVEQSGGGVVFRAGDAGDLARTIATLIAPAPAGPIGAALTARDPAEHSNRAVAARHLAVLDRLTPATPASYPGRAN